MYVFNIFSRFDKKKEKKSNNENNSVCNEFTKNSYYTEFVKLPDAIRRVFKMVYI